MKKRLTVVVAVVVLGLLFSIGAAISATAGRREGYRAGLQDGANRKQAEMLRSFDDVRQVAVESLRREFQCELGKDFGKDPLDR